MNWNSLLNNDRLFTESYPASSDYDLRSEYQRDIDRILFSSAFRRLQDKTQVMPFPGSDFIHTRLTHSLEVSSIGRSLGKLVGRYVIEKEGLSKYTPDDFGNIVVAACLAHDIGNPPFGHSGEKAIGKSFKRIFEKWQKEGSHTDELEDIGERLNDFIAFEGNAAGFRILVNDHPSGIKGGLRLTYATLGAFTKYPCNSLSIDRKGDQRKSQSKFGFFFEEETIFSEIAQKLELIRLHDTGNFNAWCRHPLSFLVEAADTFTYKIIDLEDAHKIGCITTEEASELLYRIVCNSSDDRCNKDDWKDIKNKDEQIGALRSKALNALIHEAYVVYKNNYDKIMVGEFDMELADNIESSTILKEISKLTMRKFFRHSLVIDVELSGFEVFDGLIKMFVAAIDDPTDDQHKRLLLKLPAYLMQIIDEEKRYYKKLLLITDYLSRMTDSFAVDLYRKLKGIDLANH